jgi:hypothetical protein
MAAWACSIRFNAGKKALRDARLRASDSGRMTRSLFCRVKAISACVCQRTDRVRIIV